MASRVPGPEPSARGHWIREQLEPLWPAANRGQVAENTAHFEPGADGLAIVVEWTAAFARFEVPGWEHRLQFGEPGESGESEDFADVVAELADLVAAALFGRLRVVTELRRGHVVGYRVEFLWNGRWLEHARTRRVGWWRFWQRCTRRVACNRLDPPPGIRLAAETRLASAPWVGLIVREHGDVARELVIDGELDLHPFAPKEVTPLLRSYIEACLQRGITQLRIVHGKGTGALRRTVHAELARHPAVAHYRLGGMGEGSWGATLVDLRLRKPER